MSPERAPAWRRLRARVRTWLIGLAARSGRGASLYYALCSRDFDREHRAVLQARWRNLRGTADEQALSHALRRNVHMLEKGLSARDRRQAFAAGYIDATLDTYAALIALRNGAGHCRETLWAHDVLEAYFAACAPGPEREARWRRFHGLPVPLRPGAAAEAFPSPTAAPYRAGDRAAPAVGYEALLSLALRRRSVRWFQRRPVERSLLDQAMRIAALSPSASNRMPYEFLVLDDPPLLRRLAVLPRGASVFAGQVPALVVVLGDLSAYAEEAYRHTLYVDAALAAMSFMYAAEVLGLGTCPINWADIDPQERAFYEILPDIPPYKRPVLFIAVGYADESGLIPFSSRKENARILRYPAAVREAAESGVS